MAWAVVTIVAIVAAASASTTFAPIMPLAARSLLLDLTIVGERVVAAGERGHILYSDDRGETWQQARVPTTQMLTAVYFPEYTRGWAVGHDGLILVSDDIGETWRVQRDGLAAQQQVNLEQREQAHHEIIRLEEAVAEASEDRLADLELALEDARLDLEDADLALEEDVFTSALLDVWFADESRGWATGAFGTLLATDNGGRSWNSIAHEIENPDEFHLNAITGDGKGRIFIAGEAGMMFRSLDNGRTWEALESFYEGSWFGVLYNAADDSLLVFGLRGNLYRSRDFGDSWEQESHDVDSTLLGGAVSEAGDVALVAGVGTVLLSDGPGGSFRSTRLTDRLNLSAALFLGERLILAGQGGVKFREVKEL